LTTLPLPTSGTGRFLALDVVRDRQAKRRGTLEAIYGGRRE
jgi:hypothetical protein